MATNQSSYQRWSVLRSERRSIAPRAVLLKPRTTRRSSSVNRFSPIRGQTHDDDVLLINTGWSFYILSWVAVGFQGNGYKSNQLEIDLQPLTWDRNAKRALNALLTHPLSLYHLMAPMAGGHPKYGGMVCEYVSILEHFLAATPPLHLMRRTAGTTGFVVMKQQRSYSRRYQPGITTRSNCHYYEKMSTATEKSSRNIGKGERRY